LLLQALRPQLLLGFTWIYSDGFSWTQVYANAAFSALNYVDNLGFTVFAFFKCALWTNTDADLASAWLTFGEVNGYWGFMFVHANQQLNKRQ
jgi:hypothetical protein